MDSSSFTGAGDLEPWSLPAGAAAVSGVNPYAFAGGARVAARSSSSWERLVGEEAGVAATAAACGANYFLEACFLCRKPLAGNRDIYMYRGDTPFCSEECRREQMAIDEEKERKAKKKIPMRSASSLSRREVEAPPKSHEVRAGSILAG